MLNLTREECDELTNIVKSRIVDSPMIRGIGLGRLNEMPNKTGGSDMAFIKLICICFQDYKFHHP